MTPNSRPRYARGDSALTTAAYMTGIGNGRTRCRHAGRCTPTASSRHANRGSTIMTLNDLRGAPVSTTNRASLDGLELAYGLFQGYFNDPMAEIDAVLANDPDFMMGHAFRAGLFL